MHFDHLRRRQFITLLGGAVCGRGRSQRTAQQPAMPVVGYLGGLSPDTLCSAAWPHSTRGSVECRLRRRSQCLASNIAGRRGRYDNIASTRQPNSSARRVSRDCRNGRRCDLRTPPRRRASQYPFVFAVTADPVKTGLVASLNRPGGNVTGVNFLP